MIQQRFDWPRFWYLRDGETPWIERGLLSSFYDSEHGLDKKKTLFKLTELLDIPCLILLGEPGMGKSDSLKETHKTLQNTEEDRFDLFDLPEFSSTNELVQSIFTDNQDFIEWKTGDFDLHLFLDSLDEAFIRVRKITERLNRFFEELFEEIKQDIAKLYNVAPSSESDKEIGVEEPLQDITKQPKPESLTESEKAILEQVQAKLARLRLRIVCRTADWQHSLLFEEQLQKLWGKDAVKVFVLAPLRQRDVLEAANQNNIDADRFWLEVKNKTAEVFCSDPIMLKVLINEFYRTNTLPKTKREIYRKGCLEYCREVNVTHAESHKSQPEQRFIIAARIAALTIFTGRSGVVWQNMDFVEDALLSIDDCTEGKETIDEHEFYVYEGFVHETLGTALFHGGTIRQWTQKAFSEFLAAWYIVNKLELSQIKSLIFHTSGKLIPQLEQVATWITNFNQDIFNEILRSDPQVLLRSDVATGDIYSRHNLTIALLEKCRTDNHFQYDYQLLSVLKHPGLEQIVRSCLKDLGESERAQRFAIYVATECKEITLLGDLVEIALDSKQSLSLRSNAANAILEIGDQEAKSHLKPLALLTLDLRSNGDLKRHGIRATWPHSLSAEELFTSLIVPSADFSLIDFYTTENWQELICPFLQPDDIPYALHWVAVQERSHNLSHGFAELLDAILLLGWEHLESPGVAEAYAKATVALWQNHDDVLGRQEQRVAIGDQEKKLTQEIVAAENHKRLLLLEHIIPIAAFYRETIIWKFFYDVPLLTYADTAWLIDKYIHSIDKSEKTLIAHLIRDSVHENIPEQFEYIYTVGEKFPELWQALGYQLYLELGSDEALRQKTLHLQRLENERRREQRELEQAAKLLAPLPVERVRKELKKFEQGDIDAWWRISYWLMFKPNGTYDNGYEREYDFRNLPVWGELSEEEKNTIVRTGIRFITQYEPDYGVCDRWWDRRDWIFWPIIAGCRAFFGLMTSDYYPELSGKVWQKWAPALTYYFYRSLTFHNEETNRKRKYDFLKLLKLIAHEEVTETILWIAECEDKKEHFFLASRIEDLWDDEVAQAVIDEIQQEKLSTKNASQLLSGIAAYNFSLIEDLLHSWLGILLPAKPSLGEKSIVAAQLLLQFASDGGWSHVWQAIQQDNKFGDQVISSIAGSERRSNGLVKKLTETQIADFYLWLFQHYPPENDPLRQGTYEVTVEHELADLRNSVLSYLVGMGKEESVYQVKRIQKNLDVDHSYYIRQSEFIARRNSWRPLLPEQLRSLLQNKSLRWIQSESQLLDVLEELLIQLNHTLQGHSNSISTPAVIDLWSEHPHGKVKDPKFTPKDEERLSDYLERYLKRELEERNVFIGREPQIRRASYTDILVEAKPILNDGKFGYPLTVVIEVKGCWHSELKKAMREQLVDQYLRPHGQKHGIYLVGRFFCQKWSKNGDENRWNASSRIDDLKLRSDLERQTQELGQEGFDIRVHILDAKLSA